jgi:CBS domain containing-hemolysin-like protein
MFEFALVSARRAKLELLSEKDPGETKMIREWLQTPATRDRLIAANQLGVTVVSLAIGAVGENTFDQILHNIFAGMVIPPGYAILSAVISALPLVLSLIIVTALHVIFGEQVPKVAVLRAPEKYLLFSAPIMRVFMAVFKPFINMMDWAVQGVLRIVGIDPNETQSGAMSIEEMKVMLNDPEMAEVIEKPEREMLSAVMDFSSLVVRQVAIPRTEIIAVEADIHLAEVKQVFKDNNITKLPVFEDSLDQIIGIIHIRDIIGKDLGLQISARQLAREALFVPETVSVNDLLKQFRSKRQHIAIVLDEYGGTAGLVTLEDLVEEIVGEIEEDRKSRFA